MKLMNNHEFRFHDEIQVFEKTIIDFYAHIALLNGRKIKTAVVYAYFLIYNHLTQDNIQSMTQYSKGTISTILKYLLEGNVIKKETIPGTHAQKYSSLMTFPKLDYITFEENLLNLDVIAEYLTNIINKIEQIKKGDGTHLLIQRMRDFHYFIQFRQKRKRGDIIDIDLTQLEYPVPPLNPTFDLKIKKIEEDFIGFCTKSGVLEDLDKKKAEIFSYFMTRGQLSSTKICKLTRISLPTVNKKIRELAEERFIQPNLTGDGYVLKSITVSFRLFRHYYNEYLLSWIPKFQVIQDKLRNPEQKLVFLKGYPEIYTLVDRILFDLKGLEKWYASTAPRRKQLQEFDILKVSENLI